MNSSRGVQQLNDCKRVLVYKLVMSKVIFVQQEGDDDDNDDEGERRR